MNNHFLKTFQDFRGREIFTIGKLYFLQFVLLKTVKSVIQSIFQGILAKFYSYVYVI